MAGSNCEEGSCSPPPPRTYCWGLDAQTVQGFRRQQSVRRVRRSVYATGPLDCTIGAMTAGGDGRVEVKRIYHVRFERRFFIDATTI